MNHAKDPLLGISVVLAVLGSIQAGTGLFTHLAAQYPTIAGVAVVLISSVTAGLTVYRNARSAQLAAETEAIKTLHAARDHTGTDDVA